jgi:hypothetical protein
VIAFNDSKINHDTNESNTDLFINVDQITLKNDVITNCKEKGNAFVVSKNNANQKFKRVKRQSTSLSKKRTILFY